MKERNELLETIREVLKDTHIETGRRDDFNSCCIEIEKAVSKKILSHKIDYYTEEQKL